MLLTEIGGAKNPQVTYRVNGDGSWTVVVQFDDGRRFVHTNKKKVELEKIVNARYTNTKTAF